MTKDEINSITQKLVIPYYGNPDRLAQDDFQSMRKLSADFFKEGVIDFLLTDLGWRGRTVATTVIGAYRIERYIPYIESNFVLRPEYYQSIALSFALTRIASNSARQSLERMSTACEQDHLSFPGIGFIKAAQHLLNNLEEPSKFVREIGLLKLKLQIWRDFVDT